MMLPAVTASLLQESMILYSWSWCYSNIHVLHHCFPGMLDGEWWMVADTDMPINSLLPNKPGSHYCLALRIPSCWPITAGQDPPLRQDRSCQPVRTRGQGYEHGRQEARGGRVIPAAIGQRWTRVERVFLVSVSLFSREGTRHSPGFSVEVS